MLTLDQKLVDEATDSMLKATGKGRGATATKDVREQVIAFILALDKNIEREETYHGMWKHDDLTDLSALIAHKAKRLANAQDHLLDGHGGANLPVHDTATDDALDIINYSAFCSRLVHYSARDHTPEG